MTKQCTKCLLFKSADCFYAHKTTRSGLHSQCKACEKSYQASNKAKERQRQYRLDNLGRLRAYDRERNAKPEKKERNKKYLAQYYLQNKEKAAEQTRQWRAQNRERWNAVTRKAYWALKRATPKWLTRGQKKEIAQYYAEAKDLSWLSEGGLSVDHIIPIQGDIACGLHTPWNLQIIPIKGPNGNCAKGNRVNDGA